jgi:hypothetical protein
VRLANETDVEVFWAAYMWSAETNSRVLKLEDVLPYVGHSVEMVECNGSAPAEGDESVLHGPRKDAFFFVPKVPVVKRMPETGFATGFCLLSELVCQELLVCSVQNVLAEENAGLLFAFGPPGVLNMEVAKRALRASVGSSLQLQKRKLPGGDASALDELMNFSVRVKEKENFP